MSPSISKPRDAAVLALALLLAAPGCAWRKTVRRDLAAIDQRITAVEGTAAENGRRIREHDVRLATIGSRRERSGALA